MGKKNTWRYRLVTLILIGFMILATADAFGAAEDIPFYKNKVVTWIVSTKPGGGYDAYPRLIAPYLQKNLPGSTVIVRNVPGAGHIIGVNHLYEAKPDGLTLGTFNAGLIFQQLVANKDIRFDLGKLTYLGNAVTHPLIFVVGAKTPYKTFDDIIKNHNKVVLGAGGVGSINYSSVLMLNKIFGISIKVVAGYGGAEADMAMIRGEVNGQIGRSDQMIPLIESGQANAILFIGGKSEDIKEYPKAKLLNDITPESGRPLTDLMIATAALSRPIAAPPSLPEGRAKVLKEGLWKAMNDPELQKIANRSKLYVHPLSGEEALKMVKAALNQTKDVIELVKESVKEE